MDEIYGYQVYRGAVIWLQWMGERVVALVMTDRWCSLVQVMALHLFNALRPRQNGRLFADNTFKRIFLNENIRISIKISLKFVPKGLINNIPALVPIMAWRRPGDKPLYEPMMVRSLTHICVTQPQWVNTKPLCEPVLSSKLSIELIRIDYPLHTKLLPEAILILFQNAWVHFYWKIIYIWESMQKSSYPEHG